ncbi:natural cytotoxicity triggering receptor 3-like [Aquarana catesbeiana]|uniref:natural cytotoxicity triggering receptor 3-like n=1 Tax=Aquarana catesbeiana TaxID=8400 RepID=UPI003CCA53BD
MRRLRLLLLLLGPLQGFLSQTIHISQIPVIFAAKGSSVTIPCDYNISSEQEATIGSYKWYKHSKHYKMEISSSNSELTGRISRADTDQFINERSAAIVLHRVRSLDSGMYYCEVSFQIGSDISLRGDGTFLNVTGSMDELWQENDLDCNCSNDSKKSHMICILLKAVGLVVILLTALFGYLYPKICE